MRFCFDHANELGWPGALECGDLDPKDPNDVQRALMRAVIKVGLDWDSVATAWREGILYAVLPGATAEQLDAVRSQRNELEGMPISIVERARDEYATVTRLGRWPAVDVQHEAKVDAMAAELVRRSKEEDSNGDY